MVESEHYGEVFISFSFSSLVLFLSILYLLSFLLNQSNTGRGREYGMVRNHLQKMKTICYLLSVKPVL